MADISSTLKQTGIQLEAEALAKFGAAVRQQQGGPIDRSAINRNAALQDIAANYAPLVGGDWNATSYAAAMASGADGYDPKTKFLFKVKFLLNPAVIKTIDTLGGQGNELGKHLSFTIKQIDLPKIDFEYDDVNMYNFRTKVLKSIKNRQVTLTFYDDTGNHSLSFINIYAKLLMPITRVKPLPNTPLEDFGFAFSPSYSALDTSFRAVLPDGAKDVISEMTIEQIYVKRAGGTVNSRTQVAYDHVMMNSFTFINPRMTTLDISDQDHEQGGSANMITTAFEFDSINIQVGGNATNSQAPSLTTGDILYGVDRNRSSVPPQEGGGLPPPDTNTGQRSISTGRAALQKAVIFGVDAARMGTAATKYQIQSALGSAAQRTLRNVVTGTVGAISKPKSPAVVDSNSGPSDPPQSLSGP